ncbi:MAG: family 2A encapsulin nanocompartment cargo protein cysteine desulfurase [Methylococcales bacterium]|nr:family 2A encapsulin nanocompartment cargo protein cysteine desulfurase [Methylococcales bacterium]
MTINNLTPGHSPDTAAIEQQLTRLANELFAELPSGSSHLGGNSVVPHDVPSQAQLPTDLPTVLQPFATPNISTILPPRSLATRQGAATPNAFDLPADVNVSELNTSPRSLGSGLNVAPPSAFVLPNGIDVQKLIVPRNVFEPATAVTSHESPFYFLNEIKQPFTHAETSPKPQSKRSAFDVNSVRRDFPILNERVNGRQLVWFDNAATTQKPQSVIDRVSYFYEHENSNIHRAAHELAARASDAYEKARQTVADFVNAPSADNIIFVRGTTEAINLIAKSWGVQNIGKDDEIVITWLEHHANIVPWQQLCEVTGAKLRVAPVDDSGQVLLGEYQKLLNSKTKLVSFTQVSNALGTITPAHEIIEAAHRVGAKVLLDAAQSVSHIPADVQSLDCDWLVFSGHKIFAPTGIGAVYGKADLLEATQPWQGGGNMIEDVTFEKTVYKPAPSKFEAGTGNIADAVGLGAALEYVQKVGIQNIAAYEHELLAYAMDALRRIDGLTLIGTAKEKTSVLSFVLKGHDTLDIGKALNREGIAVRAGHHCAQPILRRFGLETTVRPSLAFYNTHDEVDHLVRTVRQIQHK